MYKFNFNVYLFNQLLCICSIKYCAFVQYNERSTCSNVGFRLSSQHGFLYSAPLTFLLGQTRKLHTTGQKQNFGTFVYLWTYLCGFVYYCARICLWIPPISHYGRQNHKIGHPSTIQECCECSGQCTSYSLRIALASYSWWQNCELQTKPIESANANCSPRKKNVFQVAPLAQMGRTYHFLVEVKNSTTKPEGLNRADCSVWKVDPTILRIWQDIS